MHAPSLRLIASFLFWRFSPTVGRSSTRDKWWHIEHPSVALSEEKQTQTRPLPFSTPHFSLAVRKATLCTPCLWKSTERSGEWYFTTRPLWTMLLWNALMALITSYCPSLSREPLIVCGTCEITSSSQPFLPCNCQMALHFTLHSLKSSPCLQGENSRLFMLLLFLVCPRTKYRITS